MQPAAQPVRRSHDGQPDRDRDRISQPGRIAAGTVSASARPAVRVGILRKNTNAKKTDRTGGGGGFQSEPGKIPRQAS